jgi:hypothetical protein
MISEVMRHCHAYTAFVTTCPTRELQRRRGLLVATAGSLWAPAAGDSGLEALRILKRRLSDVVYAALRADLPKKLIETAA